MANYNVTLNVGLGKGAYATFSATNGDGLSSTDPLVVSTGDTITFIRHSGAQGSALFQNLSIFTDNSNITIASGGSSVTRTVSGSGSSTDTITGYNNAQNNSDFFYFSRQAPAPSYSLGTVNNLSLIHI